MADDILICIRRGRVGLRLLRCLYFLNIFLRLGSSMDQHIRVGLLWQSRCFLLDYLMLKRLLEWSWHLERRRRTTRRCSRNFLRFWWLKSTCWSLVKIYTRLIHVLLFGFWRSWRWIVVVFMKLVFHFMRESYLEIVVILLLCVAGLLLLDNFEYPMWFLW